MPVIVVLFADFASGQDLPAAIPAAGPTPSELEPVQTPPVQDKRIFGLPTKDTFDYFYLLLIRLDLTDSVICYPQPSGD